MKRLCAFLWCLVACPLLWAHPTLDSRILLDFQRDRVHASVSMPLTDLLVAQPALASNTGSFAELDDAQLRNYIAAHIRVGSPDGNRWEARILGWQLLSPTTSEHPPVVQMDIDFHPNGSSLENITLQADFIAHEVRNHHILVLLRSDWDAGLAVQEPQLLGSLGSERNQLAVTRQSPAPLAAWWRMVRMGSEHIAEGADHMLFVALVLLASCLVRRERQWVDVKLPGKAFRSALGLLTAFTLGHSVTLALAALGVMRFSSRWIESLVALSIVLSAWHVVRPMLKGQEVAMAWGFGLIHGLAFAQALELLHLETRHRVAALLGFNLGVELAQILLAAALLPFFLWALRLPAHFRIRELLGSLGALTGVVWLVERVTG